MLEIYPDTNGSILALGLSEDTEKVALMLGTGISLLTPRRDSSV